MHVFKRLVKIQTARVWGRLSTATGSTMGYLCYTFTSHRENRILALLTPTESYVRARGEYMKPITK